MSDLDMLRGLGDQIFPPAFDALRRRLVPDRHRRQR